MSLTLSAISDEQLKATNQLILLNDKTTKIEIQINHSKVSKFMFK